MTTDVLDAIGLDTVAAAVYEAIVDSSGIEAAELSAAFGLRADELAGVLGKLESHGLVSRNPNDGARYVAVAPAVALEALVLAEEERLKRIRIYAERLAARHQRADARRDPVELVEVVTGPAAVLARCHQLQLTARSEVRAFDRPPYGMPTTVNAQDNPAELDGLRRGVRFRVIYAATGLEYHDLANDLEVFIGLGEQARVLPDLPTKLMLVDDRLAYIPLRAAPADMASCVIVHPSGLLQALSGLFEALWEPARPLALPTAESVAETGPTADERRLLALLATGIPDKAIANQLRISYRTLRRRVEQLMSTLDATTRFEAGLRAGQLGWLPGHGDRQG